MFSGASLGAFCGGRGEGMNAHINISVFFVERVDFPPTNLPLAFCWFKQNVKYCNSDLAESLTGISSSLLVKEEICLCLISCFKKDSCCPQLYTAGFKCKCSEHLQSLVDFSAGPYLRGCMVGSAPSSAPASDI